MCIVVYESWIMHSSVFERINYAQECVGGNMSMCIGLCVGESVIVSMAVCHCVCECCECMV